ncbi:MAG: rod shape-determining protein MreC [Oscillospiraceae bacterium]|nr:rod shape-determining protein MreC [Oscillospiraceae bacterium]
MKDFFTSLKFKILCLVAALLIGLMFYAAGTGGFSTLPSSILGGITSPFQKLSSSISAKTGNFLSKFVNAEQNELENIELKDEISRLRKQLVDYSRLLDENEQLREILQIKEIRDDFVLTGASVISRDPNVLFNSFTIDKGLIHGVKLNDPVIVSGGLIGRVDYVGSNFSTVVTLLSPEMKVSVYEISKGETGIIEGDIALAKDGFCKLVYIDKDTAIIPGDIVVTSGSSASGLLPGGLVVGTVVNITAEEHGKTVFATIKPVADIDNLKGVIVIKDFEQQQMDLNQRIAGESGEE